MFNHVEKEKYLYNRNITESDDTQTYLLKNSKYMDHIGKEEI